MPNNGPTKYHDGPTVHDDQVMRDSCTPNNHKLKQYQCEQHTISMQPSCHILEPIKEMDLDKSDNKNVIQTTSLRPQLLTFPILETNVPQIPSPVIVNGVRRIEGQEPLASYIQSIDASHIQWVNQLVNGPYEDTHIQGQAETSAQHLIVIDHAATPKQNPGPNSPSDDFSPPTRSPMIGIHNRAEGREPLPSCLQRMRQNIARIPAMIYKDMINAS